MHLKSILLGKNMTKWLDTHVHKMTDNRLTETVDCMDNTLSLTQSKVI